MGHFRGLPVQLTRPVGSPDPVDLEAVRAWVHEGGAPTVVDIFSGAGGLSLGLRDAGFRILVGADHDRLAVETHEGNLGGLGYCGDLGDPTDFLCHLAAWGVDTVDVVAGGPPCQPFSRAGRSKLRDLVESGVRNHRDERADLWTSYIAVVEALRPRAVLMENVPDLAAWDDGAVLIGCLESLRGLGYSVQARILEAADHGVPQFRTRLFLVGFLDGAQFDWPEPLDGPTNTVRGAIGDLPAVRGGQRRETIPYLATPFSPLAVRLRRDVGPHERNLVHDHITREVRPDDAEAFALLPEGGTYEDLPPHLQRYRVDIFTDKYKRLDWDGLGRTITAHIAKDGYWYIHPEQHRTLSVREAARIQTFPDWFRFAGEPSHRYRQIGNAVPPLLGEALGGQVRQALEQHVPRQPQRVNRSEASFRDDLIGWHKTNRRDYPWRHGTNDAWSVFMAEMCLQRTRADQVVGVFEALVRIAPTPGLMVANRARTLEAMRPLGLRWRAEKLVEAAAVIADEFDGVVPDSDRELRLLPGVGDYASQAVLCFGFGRRAVLIDTNTARIVRRIHARDEPYRRWQMRLDLHALAGERGPDAPFNYALLDLGAAVCRAGTPDCGRCPVARHCAIGSGMVDEPPRGPLRKAVS